MQDSPQASCGVELVQPAARSPGGSRAAPLKGIRQHEQVQAGDKLQGGRGHRQGAQPGGVRALYYGKDVDNDAAVKTMDSQRCVCRTRLFQFYGTSFQEKPRPCSIGQGLDTRS